MPPFSTCRRYLGCAAAALVLLLASCGRIAPSGFSGDVNALLSEGAGFVVNLSARPASELADHEVIALGYVERARLGLGSPFRLVEYVLRDPDLPEEVQTLVAYGLIARTLEGATYSVDPRVLDIARLAGVPAGMPTGYAQLRLMEDAIESAPTATAGERTIRLAYLLAASERTVDPSVGTVVAHVAAMLGDRRRAAEDASSLLRTAARSNQDPLVLVRAWRRELRFGVEKPRLVPATLREEEAEARDGPQLAVALRSLAQRLGTPTTLVGEVNAPEIPHLEPVLDGAAADRLRALAETRDYPAQAPIAVAVDINRDGLMYGPRLRRSDRLARERFATESWNEERLTAGAAILRALGADSGQRPPLVLLQAATFLRVWNQEEPWFPGDPAPKEREVVARFGLEEIRFGDDVPDSWHPYYVRMLARGLTDLQRILPMTSVRGMAVVIGDIPGSVPALALHEPSTRTLYLPPRSGAGTLAHELAHDLDWQLARKRYGARGGYATDMAIRNNRGDRIASAMMELSASLVQPSDDDESTPHLTRPAEVFARGTDWLVAAVLARDGRLGGYLTSFQDPVLTGYGTTRGPDITGGAVPALIAILDAISPVPEPTREWALDTYGPSRSLMGIELARAVSDAGANLPLERRLDRIHEVGLRSFQAVSDCRYGSAAGARRLVTAQRTLARASVDAAARGAAVDAIRAVAAGFGDPELRAATDSWISARLSGLPGGQPTEVIAEFIPMYEQLLARAAAAGGDQGGPVGANAFQARSTPSLCGGNPFAADSPVVRFRISTGGRNL